MTKQFLGLCCSFAALASGLTAAPFEANAPARAQGRQATISLWGGYTPYVGAGAAINISVDF
ncbi:MAG: hypothetical protein KF713_18250 [Turneriella sp.]|nr:hypothetical protein [Turneriella sp.]